MRIALTMPPEFDAVGETVDAFVHALWPEACSASDTAGSREVPVQEEFRLALSETLNNVLEHSGHPADRPIVLSGGRDAQMVWLEVTDAGAPLPASVMRPPGPDALAEPDPAGSDALPGMGAEPWLTALDDLPEGGWGWSLIHASVDRVTYARKGGTNRLRLEKNVPPG